MDSYIKQEDAIAKLTDLNVVKPNATMIDVKRLLEDIPGAKVVSLHDIYRVIAGHSCYHGDCILAALTCIAEGKEVKPVCPADVAPVAYGQWVTWEKAENFIPSPNRHECSVCHDAAQVLVNGIELLSDYCPNCGAKMDD